MPFSTPGKKPLGTDPPTIRSANSTPPSGFGSSSIHTSPNIPWPPVCFLYRPWAWVLPRIVSLYGTRGVWVTMAAPNLRLSRSMMTALCASPIVRRTCSPVAERSSRTVGSSSSIRASAGPILSRSPLLWGSMATISDGSGKASGGRTSAFSRTVSVSPVSVTASLATAPISPALSSPMGSCSLPWSSSSCPIRSSSSRLPFQTWACERSVPDSTRRYVSRPTNGSAVVLNTRTSSGPLSSAATSTVAPDLSVALVGGSSAGEGR